MRQSQRASRKARNRLASKRRKPSLTVESILSRTSRVGDCQVWLGARYSAGYAHVWDPDLKKAIRGHRKIMSLVLGRELSSDEYVLHSCDNPPCCNPDHLSIGTKQQNTRQARDRTGLNTQKLLPEDARSVRERFHRTARNSSNAYALAEEYGVSSSTIYAIVNGTTWLAA